MSSLQDHIRNLELAGLFDKDSDYDGMLGNAVKELLEVFAKQGHSGASAELTADLFHALIVRKEAFTEEFWQEQRAKMQEFTDKRFPKETCPDEWVDWTEKMFEECCLKRPKKDNPDEQ